MDDLVSIITPVYNSDKYLEESIQSVLNQSYGNWELRIVDDASKDNSSIIMRKYALLDSRIKPIFLNDNIGAGLARNIAIEKAQGSIIAFLDSDDVWESSKLEIHVRFMLNNKAAFSHSSYGFINENGKKINKTFHVSKNPVGYEDLLKRTEISCLTAMYNVNIVGKMYMPNLRVKQDYALWLSILKKGFYSIPLDIELAHYRQRKNSNTSKKHTLIIKHLKFLREVEGLGWGKTIYYTLFWAMNGILKYYLSKLI